MGRSKERIASVRGLSRVCAVIDAISCEYYLEADASWVIPYNPMPFHASHARVPERHMRRGVTSHAYVPERHMHRCVNWCEDCSEPTPYWMGPTARGGLRNLKWDRRPGVRGGALRTGGTS